MYEVLKRVDNYGVGVFYEKFKNVSCEYDRVNG